MIGKIAYSNKTGEPLGEVVKDGGSTWHVKTVDGQLKKIMKMTVTFDETLAAEIRAKPDLFNKANLLFYLRTNIPLEESRALKHCL